MKRMLVIILAVVIGLALTTTGFAVGQDTKSGKSRTYTGEVTSVDPSAKSVVVKGKDGDKTFDLADATWKGYASIDEVKPGDRITVKYTEKDGTMSATSVAKAKAKTKKTTTKKSTTTETQTDSSDSTK